MATLSSYMTIVSFLMVALYDMAPIQLQSGHISAPRPNIRKRKALYFLQLSVGIFILSVNLNKDILI